MRNHIIAIIAIFLMSSCSMGYYSHTGNVNVAGRVNISMQPSWGPLG